jgi:hypothetical protein
MVFPLTHPLFLLSTGVPMDLLETRLVWKVSRINNMDHWDNDWYLLVALETAAVIFGFCLSPCWL